ncbi:heavy metal sensor histidine kinase [Paraburkholderia sp. C35]|uniref:heavy metal sensor histidine kinase n=1 Tax=Paraburkholderia sp. C35 TaxID=2126993 RepID=UPI000D697277|nr:heavy metal sensor histidine kinase [Paraburkholderia sp. C35]
MLHHLLGTLRLRLTALVVLCASVALSISGLAVYEAMMSRVESYAADQMTDAMSSIEARLSELNSTVGINRDPDAWTVHLQGHEYMALGIFDMTGKVLAVTPGFRDYSPLHDVQTRHNPVSLSTPTSALRYLVAVLPLHGRDAVAVRVAIQYDTSEERALIRSNVEIIAVTEMVGVLLAAMSAYGATMFGLSPLSRLVVRIEQMSISRLGQPLPQLASSGELLELGHAFNSMLARLDESFTRLNEFSSNLAHDLRTPLTNLRAAAQVALAQSRAAPEYREVIESSIDEYERLSRMIDDMLFLARAERSELALAMQTFDTADEANRVAGFYESLMQESDMVINVRGQGVIHADLILYQRALSNLLANAIAHSPRHSTIDIECIEEPGAVLVLLSDNGPGIAAVHIEHIFERFYRVESTRNDALVRGAGIGLAIVKSIMDMHDGKCGVVSDAETGTTFWLRFVHKAHSGSARAKRSL